MRYSLSQSPLSRISYQRSNCSERHLRNLTYTVLTLRGSGGPVRAERTPFPQGIWAGALTPNESGRSYFARPTRCYDLLVTMVTAVLITMKTKDISLRRHIEIESSMTQMTLLSWNTFEMTCNFKDKCCHNADTSCHNPSSMLLKAMTIMHPTVNSDPTFLAPKKIYALIASSYSNFRDKCCHNADTSCHNPSSMLLKAMTIMHPTVNSDPTFLAP
ncbi:hypothetical protein CEXT_81861 [Caerostris extrusa]|uniref:Uncharacterized protein n=1 Tax=Caerostris extrusa TaxID=172846 RepID=A0AAV4NLF8_CAEEX|nr:hypothetical protein CEXT_81861 [Caerostris extrusa]